jgi:hypothetical protein
MKQFLLIKIACNNKPISFDLEKIENNRAIVTTTV